MKRVALLLWFMMGLLIISAISAPDVQAQKLDGVWLNMKFNAQLYRVDPDTGAYTKQKGSGNDYMHFTWMPQGYYEIEFWTLDDHGNYIHVEDSLGPFRAYPNLPGENFIPEFSMKVPLENNDWIEVKQCAFIEYKEQKGVISKIKLTSRGYIPDGNFEGKRIFGWGEIKGTSVREDKLPFDPAM